MKLWLDNGLIPGTVLKKEEKGNLTGMAFLDNIYYVSSGVMLTQIRDISGIDGSTLQNWVKRGWVSNTVNKKYSKDQLARILIINMLRNCMLLERVDRLLHYINGELDDVRDDIIPESRLYDYICTIYDRYIEEECECEAQLDAIICETTADYTEPVTGARQRLNSALKIIIIAYLATIAGNKANELFLEL
ncbi:MAG: DUF1836 domain-containing protein [Clostridia bacterium]|nr:DUF1836 domain-containing protein [Clostridia bacterium]